MTDGELPSRPDSLRLEGFDYSSLGTGYSVTICTSDRREIFGRDDPARTCYETLRSYHNWEGWYLAAFCVMPDHLHVLAYDREAYGLPEMVRGFKSRTTRQLHEEGVEGDIWQRYYHDHIIRPSEDPKDVISYILANPVRDGLVDSIHDWPWSFLGRAEEGNSTFSNEVSGGLKE